MARPTLALVSLALASLIVTADAPWVTSSAGLSRTDSPSAASPAFHPGPSSLSGRVIRLTPDGVVVDSDGRQFVVTLSRLIDAWRETSVPASAIEVGDDLFINGIAGSPFIAPYVSANIGRIDGVIRNIDATGMLIDVQLRQGGSVRRRIDFSPYIEYGSTDGTLKLTRADLVVGRTIGAVIYGRAGGPLRATRVW